jgi:aminopeptidase N
MEDRGKNMRTSCICAACVSLVAWMGPVKAQEFSNLQLALEPVHYELDLTVDYDAEQIRGNVRLTLRSRSPKTIHEIPLLLYRLMTVTFASDEEGHALPVIQRVVAFEDFGKRQANYITVSLEQPLEPRDTTTIEVDYEGHLLGYAETGSLYIKDRVDPSFTIIRTDALAYPLIGVPSRRVNRSTGFPTFTYVAKITVPEYLTVANGGQLLERSVKDDRVSFVYQSKRPSWRMDFAIAEYEVLEHGATRVVHFPEDSIGAAGVMNAIRNTTRLYSEWFGPLQEEAGLTVIEIPDGWGSQADVTTIIQTAPAFKDPSGHSRVYHELSHLWNVIPTDQPSPRWNEGLASFLAYLTAEELDGRTVLNKRVASRMQLLRERFAEQPRYRETPMIDYGKAQLTDLSYRVGMVMFHVLYQLVGADQFNRIIAGFYREYAVSGATTDDFAQYANRVTTTDLTPFFHDWLYTTNWYTHVEAGASVDEMVARYREEGGGGSEGQ